MSELQKTRAKDRRQKMIYVLIFGIGFILLVLECLRQGVQLQTALLNSALLVFGSLVSMFLAAFALGMLNVVGKDNAERKQGEKNKKEADNNDREIATHDYLLGVRFDNRVDQRAQKQYLHKQTKEKVLNKHFRRTWK